MILEQNLEQLKTAYNKAVLENNERFTLTVNNEPHEFITKFAKYLIEYAEQKKVLSKETEDKIVKTFIKRCHVNDIRRFNKKYYENQIEYFSGVIITLDSLKYKYPPMWMISLMSKREVITLEQLQQTKQN